MENVYAIYFNLFIMIYEETSQKIIKGKFDKNQYQYFKLANGLKFLAISDPKTEKSAAGLCVGVGSGIDPKDCEGLAHLCEHVIFLGSEKYPIECHFDEKLSESSGETNANTSDRYENFMFSTSNECFYEILDIFGHLFIHPLFSESSVLNELKAVDNEFTQLKTDDISRMMKVCYDHLNPESPLSREGKGNKEMLTKAGINLGEKVKEFYRNYFSSNIMSLVVYSNLSISQITSQVIPIFSLIPNKNIKPIDLSTPPLSTPEFSGKLFKLVPIKAVHEVNFIWTFDLYKNPEEYKNLSFYFLSSIIGDETEKSLLSVLKEKKSANKLTIYYDKDKNYLFLNIELTDKSKYIEVIELTFQYIDMLRKSDIPLYLYEDEAKISRLNFDITDKKNPFHICEKVSKNLYKYPFEYALSSQMVMIDEYNPKIIKSILDDMTPQKAFIFFVSKANKSIADRIEPRYGTKYQMNNISNEIILNSDYNPLKQKFEFINSNPYIPSNIDIITDDIRNKMDPTLIKYTENYELWYKFDSNFELPFTYISVNFFFEKTLKDISPINSLERLIMCKCIKEYLNKEIYMASKTLIQFHLKFINQFEWNLTVKGFYSSLMPFLKKIFEEIQNINPETMKAIFKRVKRSYFDKLQSIKHIESFLTDIYYSFYAKYVYTKQQYYECSNDLKFENLMLSIKNLFNRYKSTIFIYGNIALDYANELGNLIKLNKEPDNLPLNLINMNSTLKLDQNKLYICSYYYMDEEDYNCYIILSFQHCKTLNVIEFTYISFLEFCLYEPLFSELRTKKQIGYAPSARLSIINDFISLSFEVETKAICPLEAREIFLEFINSQILKFQNMKEEKFNLLKNSFLSEYKNRFLNMTDEFEFLQNEIQKYDFDFGKRPLIQSTIKEINFDTFNNLLKSLFIQNRREICCCFVNSKQKIKNEEFFEKIKTSEKEREVEILMDSLNYKQNHQFDISNRKEKYTNYLNNISKKVA